MRDTIRSARAVMVLVICLLAVSAATAAEPYGYYRWPTVHGDKVVFVAEGDLWIAPVSGGTARRLTTAPGEERFAMFSPDGKWVAFSGNYDGNLDVYVIPAEGGEPKRLTYHPGFDFVSAWTPDGKVVFRSWMDNGLNLFKCYTVPVEGGYPEMVPVDQAAHIAFEPGGDRIAYTRVSLGNRTWKRYKGGWAEQIWVGSTRSHDYRQVTTWEGNNATPMWYKDRIYYLRDNDARANLHSMKPDGSDIQQHTFHTDWDARWPSFSDGKIAYSLGADIWVFDVDRNETRKLDITLPSDRIQARDKFISPDDYTNEFALSDDGKRLLLGARGELFTAPTARRGLIRQVTRTDDAREKFAQYVPGQDTILAWSDISGEEALYLFPAKGVGEPKKLADGASGWNASPVISPDGKYAVYGDCNRKLQLVDMKSGTTSAIDTSNWEIRDYEWSPDSRYVAYTVTLAEENSAQVRVYDTREQKVHPVTDPLFASHSPSWDPKGKWLYFISTRFMNTYASANDWSFIVLGGDRLYALALDPETKSPYAYAADGAVDEEKKDKDKEKDEKKKDGDKKGKDEKDEKKEEKVEVKITWDGLMDRILELPLDPGNYFGVSAIEGKIYYMSIPNRGWRSSEFEDEDNLRASLHLFDIKKKKDSEVVSGMMGYTLSRDLKKIAVRKKSGFVIMDAGDTKEPEPDKNDKDAGLHLEDWVYDVDPRQEWRQIFNEGWRLQRDFFYDPNLHGIDWKAQREHYGKLLDRVYTRDELNDLIGQMISELCAGHAYIGGGDRQSSKTIGVGLLGVDVTRTAEGFYRIDKILKGDVWDKSRTSPLNEPGLNVKTGQYLVAIDDVPLNTVKNYLELLNNKAGKLVSVSVNDQPSLDGARSVVVMAMSNEEDARYWDWVYGRMEYVRKNGGENIAYVHLSDMSPPGMEQWMREYYPQSQKKGLIVDVRYNGGGNIAEWILGVLQRTTWSWGMARNGSRYHRPGSSFYGPMIALCNEETGSDGETFSEGWKRLKLGPLVGKRTWGGWVGIRGDKPFIDRGFFTQPEFTGWGKESTWLIEGPGVYPDVDLQNSPKKMMEGVDEQLDYAINYLKQEMKKDIWKVPPQPKFPIKTPTGYKK